MVLLNCQYLRIVKKSAVIISILGCYYGIQIEMISVTVKILQKFLKFLHNVITS